MIIWTLLSGERFGAHGPGRELLPTLVGIQPQLGVPIDLVLGLPNLVGIYYSPSQSFAHYWQVHGVDETLYMKCLCAYYLDRLNNFQ